MISSIIIGLSAAIALALCLLYIAQNRASSLILLFLAESLLIQNLHPERRPDFIIKKALAHTGAVPWIVRPLAVWYIKNKGIGIATKFLLMIKKELESDGAIESKGNG